MELQEVTGLQRGPAPTYELTFQDVLDILKLIDTSQFEELDVQIEDLRVRVSRRARGEAPDLPRQGPSEAAPRPSAGESTPVERTPEAAVERASQPAPGIEGVGDLAGMIEVKPPMAGTFYRAPAPGAPVFVEVGNSVKAGETVGIVEVMKLFTPVTSPCGGTVRAILVGNEAFVQADQTLMVIEPATE